MQLQLVFYTLVIHKKKKCAHIAAASDVFLLKDILYFATTANIISSIRFKPVYLLSTINISLSRKTKKL